VNLSHIPPEQLTGWAVAAAGFAATFVGKLLNIVRRRKSTSKALLQLAKEMRAGNDGMRAQLEGLYRRTGRTEASILRIEEGLGLPPLPHDLHANNGHGST
jgi:hypothetical protein